MEIIEKKENPYLNRIEITASESAASTLSMEDAAKKIAEKLNQGNNTENIVVKSIKGKFGSKEFIVKANVYSNAEDKQKTEPKPKTKKGKEEKTEIKEGKAEEKKEEETRES